jgi:hypothetical protein
MYKKNEHNFYSYSEISKFNIFAVLTLHCPFFKVMLLRIGNPPSPLMCCPFENTETSQCGGPYKRLCLFRSRRPWLCETKQKNTTLSQKKNRKVKISSKQASREKKLEGNFFYKKRYDNLTYLITDDRLVKL